MLRQLVKGFFISYMILSLGIDNTSMILLLGRNVPIKIYVTLAYYHASLTRPHRSLEYIVVC